MRIERLDELPTASRHSREGKGGGAADSAVVAVGNFDGVHRGHLAGLDLARQEAGDTAPSASRLLSILILLACCGLTGRPARSPVFP